MQFMYGGCANNQAQYNKETQVNSVLTEYIIPLCILIVLCFVVVVFLSNRWYRSHRFYNIILFLLLSLFQLQLNTAIKNFCGMSMSKFS